MGTPDTLIEDNLIENTKVIAEALGIKVLNGPGTVIRGNIIRNNTASGYWGVRLERDKGDAGAGNIGEGDPENVWIENNLIEGNANGIGLFAGVNILMKANILNNMNEDYYKAKRCYSYRVIKNQNKWPGRRLYKLKLNITPYCNRSDKV